MSDIIAEVKAAKTASIQLSSVPTKVKDAALEAMAEALDTHRSEILEANSKDLSNGEMLVDAGEISKSMFKRLAIDDAKIDGMIDGIRDVIRLADPVGDVMSELDLDDGLTLFQIRCPIGMLGVIFESRPDVVPQIMSLCLKSGNGVAFKGGREAAESIRVLFRILRDAAASVGIPAEAFVLMESRDDIDRILGLHDYIDLLIPRGGAGLIRACVENAKVPCIQTGTGICHVYVDKSADVEMAVSIAVDSKAQNVAVCNACETLLVHRDIAADFLPKLLPAMQEKHVRLLGDEATRAIIPVEAATEEDWRTEYLDYVLSIRVVDSLEAAIAHINRYGSHHTDCIVTRDDAAAKAFLTRVDSAGVYRNVSTRFADGFVYGFGAEVGIATGKLHARGPMGLDGLTTYKYKLLGDGQLMAEMKSGQRAYTHLVLHEDCPL